MAWGTLYLIPVRLGEIPWQTTHPLQVREIACALDYFIVENAKSARAELKHLGYPRPLQTVNMQVLPESSTPEDFDTLLQPLREGRSAGLVSEAGCPAVADPGAALVRFAHRQGIRVVPLVGPSSLLLALMASGLDGQRFSFQGYLPVRNDERRRAIIALEAESRRWRQTQLFIETPYRNLALYQSITTRNIDSWRKAEVPDLAKKPTVFLLLAP